MSGIIKNNPVNPSELEFLRNENSNLKEQNKKYEEQVRNLSSNILSI